jgi:hypothetical protein
MERLATYEKSGKCLTLGTGISPHNGLGNLPCIVALKIDGEIGKTQRGLTLIPTRIYSKNCKVKVGVGACQRQTTLGRDSGRADCGS